MKVTDFTKQELSNIVNIFTTRQLCSFQDKSEYQTFAPDDLLLLRYKDTITEYNEHTHQYDYNKKVTKTVLVSYVDEKNYGSLKDYYVKYNLRKISGYCFSIDSFNVISLNKIEIPREKYVEIIRKYELAEEKKKLEQQAKERELRRIQKEKEEAERAEAERIRKEREEAYALYKQQEDLRRSQPMTITVGEYEDIISKLEQLENDLENLRGY